MSDTNGVIYLEVDEDITSAIDKLSKSASGTVQIVTAKRSTLFQSVINLKLLHKAAKDSGKNLVLVTSDRVATNLAGKLGVPVASQVGEAAAIPKATAPAAQALADDEIDGGTIGDDDAAPKGAAAGAAGAAAAAGAKTPRSPLETPPEPPGTPTPKPAVASGPKSPRVPSIGKMQKRLLWIGGLVLIIVLLFVGNYFLESANVTLYAQGSQFHASFDFTADPTAAQTNTSSGVLTAEQLSQNKTLTASVTATGTKDDGSPASGTMTISNCYNSQSQTLVAGTRFTSPNGLVFTSTSDVTVPGGTGSFQGCASPGKATVSVQSMSNGDQYNLSSGTQYTIPGLPSNEQSSFYGVGGQMQGGVTKVDKVIQQSDVTTAQTAALAAAKGDAQASLTGKASSNQTALSSTFQQSVTSANANPAVGSVAGSATLTIQVTYTELAAQKSDLSSLAQAQEGQQLGNQSQIYDDGSSNLQFTAIGAPQSSGAQKLQAAATAYAGSKINTAALATQLKGQKYGDAVNTASSVPGVTKATVSTSPSWDSSLPHIASHIHVQIKVSNPSG